jgi:D-alanine-D-alanine ligase
MKIALTHNLKRTADEAQAEFDTPETIAALCRVIVAAGHEVAPVEVSGTLESWIAALREVRPGLVLNTAEGSQGPARTALYPGLFDALGLRYTGSDARVQLITQDKQLTKSVVAAEGVHVVPGFFRREVQRDLPDWCGSVIVKPNFEGSSKGITADSVVTEPGALKPTLDRVLRAYPDGVIVEDYVPGTDVAVGFIEGLGPEILIPCSYVIDPTWENPHRLYDFRLKNIAPDEAVAVACPAQVPAEVLPRLQEQARRAVRALGLRGIARLDFRVRDDGEVFFIEANATPSLEPGSSLFVASQREGFDFAAVIAHLIRHATR